MSRKVKKMKSLMVLGILCLAIFGGYILWERYESDANAAYDKVVEVVEVVNKSVSE